MLTPPYVSIASQLTSIILQIWISMVCIDSDILFEEKSYS